jgi:hypothetical protein
MLWYIQLYDLRFQLLFSSNWHVSPVPFHRSALPGTLIALKKEGRQHQTLISYFLLYALSSLSLMSC